MAIDFPGTLLALDALAPVPPEHQIIHQLTRAIQEGKLRHSDFLPAPAELAAGLNVAVSVVDAAYAVLEENQVLEKMPNGRWSVSRVQDVIVRGRREQAIQLLEQGIMAMEALKLSSREISALFQIILMKREQRFENFQIALVDCNPEALAIFESQLRYIARNRIFTYLLEDLHKDPALAARLEHYDLVLTTDTHRGELLRLCPAIGGRLMDVVISPSQQTVMDLAMIPKSVKIAILYQSPRFLAIVKRRLASFQLPADQAAASREAECGDLAALLEGRDLLVLPRESDFDSRAEAIPVLARFSARGGRVLRLDYQIERSSLARVEERISDILDRSFF